jgi:hypothetical protein
MPAAIAINSVDATGATVNVTGFITLSGNYPTGGDPLNFALATADPSYVGMLAAVESSTLLDIDVWSMAGSSINGSNSTGYQPVSTKAGTPSIISPATGCKLKCAALNASPTTEHSAGAYESQYTGDTIAFMAVFTKNL